MSWTPKHPDGCVQCGTTTKKHLGRGLCTTCYQREARGNSVDNFENGVTDNVAQFPSDVSNSTRNLSDVAQSPETSPRLETPPKFSERRPGDVAGPSSVPDDNGGDVPNPKRGLRGIFSKKERPEQDEPAKPTKETRPGKPQRLGRRNSTADTIEDILGAVGAVAIRTGKHQPLGRYLQFSSSVSAEILDDAVSGTMIDKMVLQPLVKGRSRFDGIAAVLGPPAIILAIENNPERAPMLLPVLKSSIRNSLPMMAKAIKKVQAKEKAMSDAAAELFPDLPEGEDPADAILAMIFDGWTPPVPASTGPPVESNETETESDAA